MIEEVSFWVSDFECDISIVNCFTTLIYNSHSFRCSVSYLFHQNQFRPFFNVLFSIGGRIKPTFSWVQTRLIIFQLGWFRINFQWKAGSFFKIFSIFVLLTKVNRRFDSGKFRSDNPLLFFFLLIQLIKQTFPKVFFLARVRHFWEI